jgi:phage baseplate assembly protein gpV
VDARGGYQSELSTTPPAPPPPRRGGAAVLGVVTRVDDPDRLGRVRVALPAHGDAETDWLQVLSVGAGAGKGLMILPDRGDRVLVLTIHGDPGQGIVLGGLHGLDGWHDAGVEGAAVRRFTLRTPGGQWLRLDDAANGVTLGDATGSYVELAPRRLLIHAAVDLEIEAPGRKVVVRGEAIDFERG